MPPPTLRSSAMRHDLSRVGFAGLRFAVILLLAAAALRTSSLAWIGAGTLVASLVLWLACLPTDAEHARLRAAGAVPTRSR
jgi:Zn-dependent membrane protease YugP